MSDHGKPNPNRKRARKRSNNRNRQQGGSSDNRNRNQEDRGPRKNGRQGGGGRRKATPPPKLTLMQKILSIFGLYKPTPAKPKPTRRDDEQRPKRAGDSKRPRRTPDSSGVSDTRLYLGNLSYDATEEDLKEVFGGVGSVRNVDIIYDRRTHRPKGFAFINMATVEEAKRAVEILDDQPFMGRTLAVKPARGQDDSESQDAQRKARKNRDYDQDEGEDAEGLNIENKDGTVPNAELPRPEQDNGPRRESNRRSGRREGGPRREGGRRDRDSDRRPPREGRENRDTAPTLASVPIVLPGESISGNVVAEAEAKAKPDPNDEITTDPSIEAENEIKPLVEELNDAAGATTEDTAEVAEVPSAPESHTDLADPPVTPGGTSQVDHHVEQAPDNSPAADTPVADEISMPAAASEPDLTAQPMTEPGDNAKYDQQLVNDVPEVAAELPTLDEVGEIEPTAIDPITDVSPADQLMAAEDMELDRNQD